MSEPIEIYVRFAETDAAGHVNNASYFLYFEEARTKFFSGLLPKERSFGFILASIKCDYIQQAYAGQTILISTEIIAVGTKSFTLRQAVKDTVTGQLIAKADSVTVCFNYKEQMSAAIPGHVKEILKERMVAID